MRALTLQEPPLDYRVVNASSDLDLLIHSEEPWYDLPLVEQQQLTQRFVREALVRHLDSCPQYRMYFERSHARVDGPLEKIPLLSTRAFKYSEVRSVPRDDIEQWYLSSGTSGGPQSRIGRDRVTIERLIGSVRTSLGLIQDWHEEDFTVINLGPGREDAGNVWFQYVMSLIELLFPTYSVVKDGVLHPDEVLPVLDYFAARPGFIGVVGPPFLVHDLCQRVRARDRRMDLGSRLTILTAGGWKRQSGRMLPRDEFETYCVDTFRLEDGSQVRDAFNQVELNTVFMECSAREKHVPPWVLVAARDPHTLEVLPPGTPGLMSYLDASSNSYPCFLVTEDVGSTRAGVCGCGREGIRVDIQRRLVTRAQKGCALAMEAQKR